MSKVENAFHLQELKRLENMIQKLIHKPNRTKKDALRLMMHFRYFSQKTTEYKKFVEKWSKKIDIYEALKTGKVH